ncbi:NAD(P)-binding domain-containing protein [Rozella allomycis CSF55]|uniref:NAD(P)-binding domain-containing protein n=1 Tax=Rozella allomycis (strain CSF55) TaxID=988480 RepID=A0A075ARI8_ROZAC|nr:NAD(P)-binding domain-containing protein [Rozella allomycis CSF55]|eukprot:EPZ31112.1 NAD(P)-binding domain-containing protein [Rozella allomycis CSF55]
MQIISFVILILIVLAIVSIIAAYYLDKPFSKFEPRGKHIVITGGSSGLGFSIAKLLVQQGANVTIIARRLDLLEQAKTQLEKHADLSKTKILTLSADVSKHQNIAAAISLAESEIGQSVDYIFTCAGYSRPGLFLDIEPFEFENGMKINYLGTVNAIRVSEFICWVIRRQSNP